MASLFESNLVSDDTKGTEEEHIYVSKTCFNFFVCFSTLGDKLNSQVLSGMRGYVWKMLVSGTFFPRCITKGFQSQRFSPHLSYAQLAHTEEGRVSMYEDQGLRCRFLPSNPHRNAEESLGSGPICLTFVLCVLHPCQCTCILEAPLGRQEHEEEHVLIHIVIGGCFASSRGAVCVVLVSLPRPRALTSCASSMLEKGVIDKHSARLVHMCCACRFFFFFLSTLGLGYLQKCAMLYSKMLGVSCPKKVFRCVICIRLHLSQTDL